MRISGTGMYMSGLIDDTRPSRDPERVFKVQPTQDSTQVSRNNSSIHLRFCNQMSRRHLLHMSS